MASTSLSEETGILVLNIFMLLIAAFLDIVGMLLWSRCVPPNPCLGIKIRSMGPNRG